MAHKTSLKSPYGKNISSTKWAGAIAFCGVLLGRTVKSYTLGLLIGCDHVKFKLNLITYHITPDKDIDLIAKQNS